MAKKLKDITRGDTVSYKMTFRDADKNPIDLTGKLIWFTLKSDLSLSDDDAAIQKVVEPSGTDAENGNSKIVLSSQDTEISPGKYFFDFQLVTPASVATDPPVVVTMASGQITIKEDVTRNNQT